MADGFHALRELLARGELVAFVGAGLSKAGGLPLWPELVQVIRTEAVHAGIHPNEIADIDRAIASGQLVDALTELERHLGTTSFTRAVARQLDDRMGPDAQPRPVPDVIQALAELAPGLRAVITTNLDAFIPRAFPREWDSFDRLTGDLAARRRYILRLHGAVHDRSTWVLTRAEYDRVMDRDPLYHTYFSAVFAAQPMLFLGFGLADPHFERIAQKIRALARGQPPHHFALVHHEQLSPAQRRKLGESGIELLGYPSHDALPEMLRSLTKQASAPGNPAGGTGVMSSAPSSAPTTPYGSSPLGVSSSLRTGSGPPDVPRHAHDSGARSAKRPHLGVLGITVGMLALFGIIVGLVVNFSAESWREGTSYEPKSSSEHGVADKAGPPKDPAPARSPYGPLSDVDPSAFGDSKWEQAVLHSLDEMKVPGLSPEDAVGSFKFQLTVCKDGSINSIAMKGGTMSSEHQSLLRLALAQHRLPKPPPEIVSTMQSSCARINYTFTWESSGVR